MTQDYHLVPFRGDIEENPSPPSNAHKSYPDKFRSRLFEGLSSSLKYGYPKLFIVAVYLLSLALAALGGYFYASSSSGIINDVLSGTSLTSSTKTLLDDTTADVPRLPALQAICAASNWTEGLYFVCDDNPGGIGNIMSLVLNCVRYAIAGGASMTLPLIEKRGQELTALKDGVYEPLSYFFDDASFQRVMAANCPQMTVLEDISQIPEFRTARVTDPLRPNTLHDDNGRLDMHTQEFQPALYTWLNFEPTLHEPAIVRISLGLFEWPIHEVDSVDLYATFGKLLRFRRDVHELAEVILLALKGQTAETGRFLGAHLRTEADVRGLWMSYNDQRDAYFAAAEAMSFEVIYLASGDLVDSSRLRVEAAKRDIKVLTKHDLLSAADSQDLAAMSWDQQGLVDYLVLKDSTYFIGSSPSSFSFALAYARHLNRAIEEFPFPKDSVSNIVGDDSVYFSDGMWAVEG